MLTIKNLDSIIGKEIQTTNAMWKVVDMYETTNTYMIKVRFENDSQTWPNFVNFRLLRYSEFQNTQNEWRMYNDQSVDCITLTKGYLHKLSVFVGILGGQLEHCSIH
jgi:hypothetical protein